jgi:alkylation response protein AidB-like acyl-CoA dehydrogenase
MEIQDQKLMDFELTKEQKEFKEEVCKFLDKEVTEGVIEESESGAGYGPHSWELMRKLGAKKWLAPSFPEEYGGLGLSRIYRYIVQRELDYQNALVFIKGLGLVGVDMAGPIILHYGSEELKKEFLPRIAQGEIELALGYTEPNAGSDLSRIAMRAIEDGDDYVITGQKTFQSHCHFAQYHWLAVRTDPDALSHKGISLFIVDLKTPGITISPLWEMAGLRTNDVFYDEVRVPKKYLVGEKNRGWYYMVSALDLERMLTVGNLERALEQLIDYTKKTLKKGVPLSKDPFVRQKLADIAIEIRVVHNLVRRVVWLQDKGIIPNYETALSKLFIGEHFQCIAQTGLEILGLYGQLRKNSKYSVLEGMMDSYFRASFLHTIGGGTSEIMRNIIALRGLGLPQ